ncbi:cation efflux family-domain-containing protein [Dissophora ornata]|nr:cation efflux family-domain-containing protein [Dissophora ornata]
MGPKSKKKNSGKAKALASLQAQVATANSTGSASPTSAPASPALPAAATSSTLFTSTAVSDTPSRPSSTVNHVAVPVASNVPLTTQEQQQVHDGPDNEAEDDREDQPLLQQPQEDQRLVQPRSPQLIPALLLTDASGHTDDHSHPHSHGHGSGHVHAPQSLVDSQSIIHKSTTPLKQSAGQNYGGTSQGPAIVNIEDSNDSGSSRSSPLRPSTPPPIACNGVLITSESTKNKRKLIFVTVLCLCFFTVEIVGGYFAKSLALMSDAFHLLSDVVSFMVSLIAIWLSEQPATKRHSFGYHRAEVLAALMSVFIIWILTAFLLMEAFERIKNPQSIDGKTMCIVASIGVAINIILAFALGHDHDHGHGHGHDHGHSHGHSHEHNHDHGHDHSHEHEHGNGHSHSHDPAHSHDHSSDGNKNKAQKKQKKEVNINVKAATLHVIGDLISSVGVLVASIIIMIKPTWTIVDPICTVLFSILVMFTTYRLVWDSLGILMEGTPTHIDPEEIEASLLEIPGVTLVHDLHVWNLTAGKASMAVHLQLAPKNEMTNRDLTMADYDRILTEAQNLVCGQFQIHHSTIQLETAYNSSEHCRPDMCSNEPLSVVNGRGYNAV